MLLNRRAEESIFASGPLCCSLVLVILGSSGSLVLVILGSSGIMFFFRIIIFFVGFLWGGEYRGYKYPTLMVASGVDESAINLTPVPSDLGLFSDFTFFEIVLRLFRFEDQSLGNAYLEANHPVFYVSASTKLAHEPIPTRGYKPREDSKNVNEKRGGLEADFGKFGEINGKSKCDVCGTKFDSSGGGKDYEVPHFKVARRVSDLVELWMNSGGVDGEGQGDDDDVTHKELIFETYELARQTVGAKHYSTILISLLLFEKTVAELNSVILLGNGGVVDEEQVALIIDVFEDVWGFAVGLGLKMGAEGILHKHAINLARIVASFGDNGSKEYAATYAMKVKDWVLAMLSGDGTYVGVVENLCAPSLNDEGGTKKKVKR